MNAQPGAQLGGAWGQAPPLSLIKEGKPPLKKAWGEEVLNRGRYIVPKIANFLENLKKICPHSNIF